MWYIFSWPLFADSLSFRIGLSRSHRIFAGWSFNLSICFGLPSARYQLILRCLAINFLLYNFRNIWKAHKKISFQDKLIYFTSRIVTSSLIISCQTNVDFRTINGFIARRFFLKCSCNLSWRICFSDLRPQLPPVYLVSGHSSFAFKMKFLKINGVSLVIDSHKLCLDSYRRSPSMQECLMDLL